ncbi:hypothetical protein C1H76_5405 [Elsinoe australis]|uniref:Uncharacterized protein n=1 Tax=Elsinoe australis TaxID=40998 RepID=A0A4V6DTZ5_9PEZI|nr:hypothetical protein C1H76_5405 [Elsinoe australis]
MSRKVFFAIREEHVDTLRELYRQAELVPASTLALWSTYARQRSKYSTPGEDPAVNMLERDHKLATLVTRYPFDGTSDEKDLYRRGTAAIVDRHAGTFEKILETEQPPPPPRMLSRWWQIATEIAGTGPTYQREREASIIELLTRTPGWSREPVASEGS